MGGPSTTLKLPLWDKASAEFCFAKSRELLTKPNPWTCSYLNIELDNEDDDKTRCSMKHLESVKINIENLKKIERNNGRCNNDNSSSSESLRMNFQRLRRKSDAETQMKKLQGLKNYEAIGSRNRASSISSESKKIHHHHHHYFRRCSFNLKNCDSSEDDEDDNSISVSETDIRKRLRNKRRDKKIWNQFRNKESDVGLGRISPPPSTSFLNSLSPPFACGTHGRGNNASKWTDNQLKLRFDGKNSDLESDDSLNSDYNHSGFLNDFPPSPAP